VTAEANDRARIYCAAFKSIFNQPPYWSAITRAPRGDDVTAQASKISFCKSFPQREVVSHALTKWLANSPLMVSREFLASKFTTQKLRSLAYIFIFSMSQKLRSARFQQLARIFS
jgi:hypothetical protein